MTATRIQVEWMTSVPEDEHGCSDYDNAEWAGKQFDGGQTKEAHDFGEQVLKTNAFGQVWLTVEHAPAVNSPEWQWERDYGADEILSPREAA